MNGFSIFDGEIVLYSGVELCQRIDRAVKTGRMFARVGCAPFGGDEPSQLSDIIFTDAAGAVRDQILADRMF